MRGELVIRNARLLDPASGFDQVTDIAISDNTVTAVGAAVTAADGARVLSAAGPGRHVTPGLIDMHAHAAAGALTPGIGMECCEPDIIGVGSGVTAIVDAGSLGVAHVGVFPRYIVPQAATALFCYLNVATHAHETPDPVDLRTPDDIDARLIAVVIDRNPGLVCGLKLRLVGPGVLAGGEDLVTRSLAVARTHGLPLMVHVGDRAMSDPPAAARMTEVTRFLAASLEPGDIVTHVCTPHPGGAGRPGSAVFDSFLAARQRGVILDAALGRNHFSAEIAREQRRAGLEADTISTDLTQGSQSFQSLAECMSKFMAVGYSFADVVRMTTSAPARVIGAEDAFGAVGPGREANLTILDLVDGQFQFTDALGTAFPGRQAIRPVFAVRAGDVFPAGPGPHPWGWLPAQSA